MKKIDLVEFVGLPGVGKTTLLQGLLAHPNKGADHFQVEINQWSDSLSGVFFSLRALFYFFIKFPYISFVILKRCPWCPNLFRRFVKLAIQYCFVNERVKSRQVFFADQWFIQELWGIAVDNKNQPKVYRSIIVLLRCYLKFPISIIYVNGSAAISNKRICSRFSGHSRYDKIENNSERLFKLLSDEKIFLKMIKVVKKLSNKMITLESESPPSDNIDLILDWLVDK